jgi:hypothetical protein
MSDGPPPIQQDPNLPPVQNYAAYPRGNDPLPRYSSHEKLQALMDGYYGLNWAFLAMVGFALLAVISLVAGRGTTAGVVLYVAFLVLALVAMGVVSYPYNKKLGFGLGWKESTPLWVSIGLSIGSCVISPIVVLIVVQLIAMGEIKNYGVKKGFFGVRKKDIKAKIEELKRQSP